MVSWLLNRDVTVQLHKPRRLSPLLIHLPSPQKVAVTGAEDGALPSWSYFLPVLVYVTACNVI